MMLLYSWETGFKIKGDITDFRVPGLIMWAVLACCRISWPVQLKHIQLIYLHTLWRRDTQEPPDGEQPGKKEALPQRPDHLEILQWRTATAEDGSWRPGLSAWIQKRETHAQFFTHILHLMRSDIYWGEHLLQWNVDIEGTRMILTDMIASVNLK